MKNLLLTAFLLISSAVFAEPSFDQIESLIGHGQYSAAAIGLEEIIKNHPQSSRAFYAMAQAQAGIGNLDKAQRALNKARGLDPSLGYVSASNVESLEQAITPQTTKIEKVDTSHFWRNLFIILVVGAAAYIAYRKWQESQDDDDDDISNIGAANTPPPTPPSSPTKNVYQHRYSPSYKTAPPPPPPGPSARVVGDSGRSYSPAPSVAPTTTVINNHSNNDLLTGVLLGEALASHSSHSDHTTVIERDIYHDSSSTSSRDSSWDAPSSSSRDSSWDDTSSRDSSWDDSSSSKRDSSWDSDSSSSSDSSWDSDSDSDSSSSSDSSW